MFTYTAHYEIRYLYIDKSENLRQERKGQGDQFEKNQS